MSNLSVLNNRRPFTFLIAVAVFSTFIFSQQKAEAQFSKHMLKMRHFSYKAGEAYKAKDWEEAIRCYGMLTNLVPFSSNNQYNLACCHALNSQPEQAIDALEKSVMYGWDDPNWINEDTDFVSLHGRPEFDEIVKKAAKCKETYLLLEAPNDLDSSKPAALLVLVHDNNLNPQETVEYWKAAALEFGMIIAAPKLTALWPPTQHGSPVVIDQATLSTIVEQAIKQAKKKYNIDEEKVVIAGCFQGGDWSVEIAGKAPEKFPKAIAIASAVQLEKDNIQSKPTAKFYMVAGMVDRSSQWSAKSAELLKAAEHKVNFIQVKGMSYELPPQFTQIMTDALKAVLSKE